MPKRTCCCLRRLRGLKNITEEDADMKKVKLCVCVCVCVCVCACACVFVYVHEMVRVVSGVLRMRPDIILQVHFVFLRDKLTKDKITVMVKC